MTTSERSQNEADTTSDGSGRAAHVAALVAHAQRTKVLYRNYSEAAQFRHFEELLERLEAHQNFLVEYTNPRISNNGPPLDEDDDQTVFASINEARRVEVSAVVQKSSKILALVFLGSLVSWLFTRVPLVNPYVAILGLFSCPFFYAMANRIGDKPRMKSPDA